MTPLWVGAIFRRFVHIPHLGRQAQESMQHGLSSDGHSSLKAKLAFESVAKLAAARKPLSVRNSALLYFHGSTRLHLGETCVCNHGTTVDFLLRPDRGIAAAQTFFRQALGSTLPRIPRKNTDATEPQST
jgi:hypothetical protein